MSEVELVDYDQTRMEAQGCLGQQQQQQQQHEEEEEEKKKGGR